MAGLLSNMAFISMPGGGEWMIILVIGLLIFGRRLPEVARGLGKSVNEFKKGLREFQDSADEVARDVNKVTSDVATEVKDASGMNDYGYEDPNSTNPYTGQYDSADSTATAEAEQYSPVEPAGDNPPVAETSEPATTTEENAAREDEQHIEPTK